MQARDIMSAPVFSISPNSTIEEAANQMLERRVSCLPVVDDEGRLVGMLTHTDFDLHRKFIALADDLYSLLGTWATPSTLEEAARKARTKLVKEVMRPNVVTVSEDAPVTEVAELMLRMKVHRLPVMRGRNLVGVITRHDLLKLIASEPPERQG